MSEDEFYETLDAFTNKAIFETDDQGRIVRDEQGNVRKLVWPDDADQSTDGEIAGEADRLSAEEITGTNDSRRNGGEYEAARGGGPIGGFARRGE